MRAAGALVLAILAMVVGAGGASADVHTNEPFEDSGCWTTTCHGGQYALADLVDGSHDWSSASPDFQSDLLDIQLATGIIPDPSTIGGDALPSITVGGSPIVGWQLRSASGTNATLQVQLYDMGDASIADPSIGSLKWVYFSPGPDAGWAPDPGWYLYSPVITSTVSFSNCPQASEGSCREAQSWGSQQEEFYFEAMMNMDVGQLVPGPCSIAGNGVQTCQFRRFIPAGNLAKNHIQIVGPLEPTANDTLICTGYADPSSGNGVTSDAYPCGTGPDPNPAQGPTLSAIDGKSDGTRNAFNCLLQPSFCGPPPVPTPPRPLIFLPGSLGSYLSGASGEEWPHLQGLLDSLRDDRLTGGWDAFLDDIAFDSQGEPATDAALDVNLGANGVITSVYGCFDLVIYKHCGGEDDYGPTLAELEADGYVVNQTLFPFGLDWRYGAEHNARLLLDEINQILTGTAAGRAAGQVDILAHSQGGLVAATAAMDSGSTTAGPSGASEIAHIVTMGTPYLGTPKFLSIYEFRDPCELSVPVEGSKVCLLNPAEAQKLSQNDPGILELLPDKNYDAAAGSFKTPLVVNDPAQPVTGQLSWQQTLDLFTAQGRNTPLVVDAADFHATHDSWAAGSTKIMRVYGDSEPTIAEVIQDVPRCVPIPRGETRCVPHTEYRYMFGDGTVVASSAADCFEGYDGRGDPTTSFSVPVYGLDHLGLAQSPSVIDRAVAFFDDVSSPPPSGCPNSAIVAGGGRGAADESGLAGTQLIAVGPVNGSVEDDQGNVTGDPDPAGGYTDQGIPDVTFDTGLNSESYFFQGQGDYQGTWTASEDGEVQLKLLSYAGDQADGIVSSPLVDVKAGAIVSLAFSSPGDFSTLQLQVDDDGNGTIDRAIPFGPPVSGDAALDTTPPTSIIHVVKRLTLHGVVAHVTVDASDTGGSGVGQIQWFVNATGQSGVYTGPLDLPAKGEIYVRAIDAAGNVQDTDSIGVLDDHPSLRELVDTFSGPRMASLGFLDYPGDIDWWGFTLPAGRERFDLAGLAADYDLALFDANGNELAESDNRGLIPERITMTLPAGTYYIRVSGHQAAWSDVSPYLLSATPTR